MKKSEMLFPDGCTSRMTLKTGGDSGYGHKSDEGIESVLFGERFRAQSALFTKSVVKIPFDHNLNVLM